VTTLGGNGLSGMSGVWIVVCDLVFRLLGMGEFNIWVDEGMRLGRWTSVAGEAWVARDGACCNLSLKIAAKSARALTVSSPTLAKGTSG
jgi:hypothetical protein